jgi:hypothetical protein
LLVLEAALKIWKEGSEQRKGKRKRYREGERDTHRERFSEREREREGEREEGGREGERMGGRGRRPEVEPRPGEDLDLAQHRGPFPRRLEPLPQRHPRLPRRARVSRIPHERETARA